MANQAKITFNKGRLSPKIDSRVDWEGYDGGCRELDNMIPDQYGNAIRRPGTEYITSSASLVSILTVIVSHNNAAVCHDNDVVATDFDTLLNKIVCHNNEIVCHDNEIVTIGTTPVFLTRVVCHENKVVFQDNDIVII